MKIIDKPRFVVGVVDILLSVVGTIICTVHHKTRGFSMLSLCFVCGIINIIHSIETRAQRQKRKEELQAIAKMYGWDKDSDIVSEYYIQNKTEEEELNERIEDNTFTEQSITYRPHEEVSDELAELLDKKYGFDGGVYYKDDPWWR